MNGKSTSSATCCFKQCSSDDPLDARVEVKTVMPKKSTISKCKPKFLVSWKSDGEAEFHTGCWDKVSTLSRKRAAKSEMMKEEKSMVKIACEAVEQFDSIDDINSNAKRAAGWIKRAKHMVVFTGAGISTSAGIGDYRGKAGKWTQDDQGQATSNDSMFNTSATTSDEPPQKKKKSEANGETDENEMQQEEDVQDEGVPYEKLRPTYTHEALYKLMQTGYLKYVISQNGDGLHTLSGIPIDKISELHGNVFMEMCEKCEKRYQRKFYVMDDAGSQYFEEIEDYGETAVKKPRHAKKCELCGLSHRTGRKCNFKKCKGFLKDTIINFRDMLEDDILGNAWDMTEDCDVMLCLGTTLQVTPASDLVQNMENRDRLIICNRQETPLDDQFSKKGKDGKAKGCRVFGNCDVFMKQIMQNIFPKADLKEWENARAERMQEYNKHRD